MKLNLKGSKLFHVTPLLHALHQTRFQAFYMFSLLNCIKKLGKVLTVIIFLSIRN